MGTLEKLLKMKNRIISLEYITAYKIRIEKQSECVRYRKTLEYGKI